MSISNYGQAVTEIFEIFRRHKSSLLDERSKVNQEIDDWCNKLMSEIGDHTRKQRSLVNEAYNIHEKHLDDIRDQCIQINRICQQNKDTEEIQRLLERCKTLKMNLVDLNFPLINKEFIEVTTIDPPKTLEEEESHSVTTENDKLKGKVTGNNNTGFTYDPNSNFTSSVDPKPSASNTNSNFDSSFKPTATSSNRDSDFGSPVNLTAAHSDRTNSQSFASQSTYDYNPPTNTTENKRLKTDVNNADNPIDKCPVCFMIFPAYMSQWSREHHADEHYRDD